MHKKEKKEQKIYKIDMNRQVGEVDIGHSYASTNWNDQSWRKMSYTSKNMKSTFSRILHTLRNF